MKTHEYTWKDSVYSFASSMAGQIATRNFLQRVYASLWTPRSARDDIIAVTRQRGSKGWVWIAGYDASITAYLYAVRRATRDLSTYGSSATRNARVPCHGDARRGTGIDLRDVRRRGDIKRTYKTLILIETIKYGYLATTAAPVVAVVLASKLHRLLFRSRWLTHRVIYCAQ